MILGLVRHLRIPHRQHQFLDSRGFTAWAEWYDTCEVTAMVGREVKAAWDLCYCSDLARAVFTAETMFQGPIIRTPLLREVPFSPVFPLRMKLPLILWQALSRIAWHPERLLEDKFHAENTYFICCKVDDQTQERAGGGGGEADLVGMVACRERRPFSLDAKISDLDSLLPASRRPCEVRLLTIRPGERHSRVFALLMKAVFAHCLRQDYDLGLISGRVLHIPLYEKLGFRPFGPRVGTAEAPYQPMFIDHRTVNRSLGHFTAIASEGTAR